MCERLTPDKVQTQVCGHPQKFMSEIGLKDSNTDTEQDAPNNQPVKYLRVNWGELVLVYRKKGDHSKHRLDSGFYT